MELSSARELKSGIISSLLTTAPAKLSVIRTFGVAAGRIANVDHVQRGLAIGIQARRPGDYRLAVRVQHRGLETGASIESIRRRAKGELEVRYIGHVTKQVTFYQRRHRPILIGTSIGHYNVTAGTLACFVKRTSDGSLRVLSNNHVFADENRASKGDAILQPGRVDGGKTSQDRIGALDDFVELKKAATNEVDCATATLGRDVEPAIGQLSGGKSLTGIAKNPEEYDLVEKIGRTSGRTQGRVTAFEVDDVTVGYDLGNLRFNGQVEIEGIGDDPFSQGGDSGSLVFSSPERLAVALLFAGSDQGGSNNKGLTYANPLGLVLRRLKCELVS